MSKDDTNEDRTGSRDSSWNENEEVEVGYEDTSVNGKRVDSSTTNEAADSSPSRALTTRQFLLALFSNIFFLIGAAVYLWMAVEGVQWAKALGQGPVNYDEYYWYQLPPNVQAAAGTLGYDQNLWDTGGVPEESDFYWDNLPVEMQQAAEVLGYNQAKWDGYGVDEDFAPAEDDYVFTVKSSGTRVSKYMMQYFVAALCFVVVGMLDLINEKRCFHSLMVLAGIFGLVSAMVVEKNVRTSNIFNLLSLHFFFLEALALCWNYRARIQNRFLPTLFSSAVMMADICFGVGALIEVVLSYFYLLDATADFNQGINRANTSAQALWVVCSLIYLAATVAEKLRYKSHDKRMSNGQQNGKMHEHNDDV